MRRVLDARLHEFGAVTAVSIDAARRRVALRLSLQGEHEPVDFVVRRFDLVREEGSDWVTVDDARASRPWLTAVLRRFVAGRRFAVSPKNARLLRLLT